MIVKVDMISCERDEVEFRTAQAIDQAAQMGFGEDDVHCSQELLPLGYLKVAYTQDSPRSNALSIAHLYVMADAARAHGIALVECDESDPDYKLDDELRPYVEAVARGEDISSYAHMVEPFVNKSGRESVFVVGEAADDDELAGIINKYSSIRTIYHNAPRMACMKKDNRAA
jgi:hypothetical protein